VISDQAHMYPPIISPGAPWPAKTPGTFVIELWGEELCFKTEVVKRLRKQHVRRSSRQTVDRL
jgi:hypothetical protein